MIFKVFFRADKASRQEKGRYDRNIICKVIAVENGQQLENRIDNVINNLKADGYDVAEVDNQASTFSDCELAATDLFTSVRIFRYMWNGMMQGKSMTEGWIMQGNKKLNEKRIHPTQKPVALYAWLLNNYAKPGDHILDTHFGSGGSMIAAWDLGFEFTGIEIDPVYYKAAVKRFHQHIAQGRLF